MNRLILQNHIRITACIALIAYRVLIDKGKKTLCLPAGKLIAH